MRHMQDRCQICDECVCDSCGGGQVEYDTVDGEEHFCSYTCWKCLGSSPFDNVFKLFGEDE